MLLTISRYSYLPHVTLGVLTVADLMLQSLEEGWRRNPHGPGGQRRATGITESCVPDGIYRLVPHTGTRFKDVWCLVNPDLGVYRYPTDVPPGQPWGRSSILIHAGNTTEDIMGCIAVGRWVDAKSGLPRVGDSALAILDLRRVLGAGEHKLEVRPVGGTAAMRIGGALM